MLHVLSVERNNHLQEVTLVFTSECPTEILVTLIASNLGNPFPEMVLQEFGGQHDYKT